MMRCLCFTLAIALLLTSCSDSPDSPKPVPVIPEEQPDHDNDIGDISDPNIFYDKFDNSLNTEVWEAVNDLWGQPDNPLHQHGGVTAANVYTQSGFLVLKSLGDLYQGELRGLQGHAQRLGGVVKSRRRFASGRFEIKMKVLQVSDMGVLSTAWTYWYKSINRLQHPEAFDKAIAHGNVPENDQIILNHEIDIEVKGMDLTNPVMTNWIGLKNNERDSKHTRTQSLLDNKFHVYRFDWHTGGNGISPEIKYYIDDQLIHSSTQHVPYIAGYFYVGNWFAWWAGNDDGSYNSPAFSSKDMLVDWVKITPFNEPNDDWFE